MAKKHEKQKPQKAVEPLTGYLDFGSNKIHASVRRGDGTQIDHLDISPALGDGFLPRPPFFNEKNLAATCGVLRKAAAMFLRHKIPPNRTRCVATKVMRNFEIAIAEIIASGDKIALRKAVQIRNRLNEAFAPYTFEVISGPKEAELVAKAAVKDIWETPTEKIQELAQPGIRVTVVHSGGLSTEIADLLDGELEKEAELDYGAHTHSNCRTEFPNNPKAAFEILTSELNKKWATGEATVLALGGGDFRAVGRLICAKIDQNILSAEGMRPRLADISHFTETDFKRFGEEKRAAHLAAAVRTVLMLLDYTDAKNVIFLNGKMVDVLNPDTARENVEHCGENVVKFAKSGAKPLSSPSVPLPTLRA